MTNISITEELTRLSEQKHPLKQLFMDRGISQALIAKYLGSTPSRISNILNGMVRTSPAMEKKLQDLADKLESESDC